MVHGLDEFVNSVHPQQETVVASEAADSDGMDSTDAEVGGHYARGPRAHTAVQPSGLTALKEQRLLDEAVRKGWVKPNRWLIDSTPTDLKNKQQERGELTAAEMAVAVSTTNMSKTFDRVAIDDPIALREISLANGALGQKAANTIVAMGRQNQTDDLMALRLQADGENAKALSAGVLEAIISQCVEAVSEAVGPERARDVRMLLAERLTVEGARRGTARTPDQDVLDMDATVPAEA